MNPRGRFIRLIFLVLLLTFTGVGGYMIIEGWSLSDSLFMTAITLSTVGYGEILPLSNVGRFFTIVLIILGVSIIAYSFSTVGEYLITLNMEGGFRQRQAKRMIKKFEDHVIICGYGQVGRSAATTLDHGKRETVVIESDPERVDMARDDGHVVLTGDAALDQILQEAGIERAWGMIVSTGSDSTNLFIVLSARTINPNLFIVARANDGINDRKMRRAGANRVVSPYQIGGRHMANIVIRPHVTDFFDVVTLDSGDELWVEELKIAARSALAGQTVGDTNLRKKTGATLIAVIRHTSGKTVSPDAQTVLEVDDGLIVLGTRQQLAEMEKWALGDMV